MHVLLHVLLHVPRRTHLIARAHAHLVRSRMLTCVRACVCCALRRQRSIMDAKVQSAIAALAFHAPTERYERAPASIPLKSGRDIYHVVRPDLFMPGGR